MSSLPLSAASLPLNHPQAKARCICDSLPLSVATGVARDKPNGFDDLISIYNLQAPLAAVKSLQPHDYLASIPGDVRLHRSPTTSTPSRPMSVHARSHPRFSFQWLPESPNPQGTDYRRGGSDGAVVVCPLVSCRQPPADNTTPSRGWLLLPFPL